MNDAASDHLVRTVLETLPHGVLVFGPDGCVRMVNDAYQRIMVGAEAVIGEHHRAMASRLMALGEYDPASATALLGLFDQFDAVSPFQHTRTRPDGTVISVRITPMPGGGLVVSITDVTARSRAETQADRRAATLRAMLDNQPDGVALFDASGKLIASNALAARLTGLGEEQMTPGRHLLELRDMQAGTGELGRTEAEVRAFIAARGDCPLDQVGRYVRHRPDGTVLEVRTDQTPDGGIIRTYRDVTEDRRIRIDLETARDAAEAASRAKSGFLATMTHELRTPLHAVIGFSEAILEEARPEAVQGYAREVLDAGRQLLGLVDGLLEATRIEAGALHLRDALFDPVPVLRAASTAARRLSEAAGLSFEDGVPDWLAPVRGDAARARQVLDALLSNAVKFTPAGGRVILSVNADPATGGTRIVLTDTGIGMAREDIPRAFEAFTQLEDGLARRYAGSGLGLYLARALTEAMGMELTIDSTPGQGTTARLIMPPAEEVSA